MKLWTIIIIALIAFYVWTTVSSKQTTSWTKSGEKPLKEAEKRLTSRR